MAGAYLPVLPGVRDRANEYLAGMAARGFVPPPTEEVVRAASRCEEMTDAQLAQQHKLYMATKRALAPNASPVNVGDLLYCRIHNRPLIECHDERNSR
jgi:hypothetical protein